MEYKSLLSENEVYLHAAAVGCQFTFENGFRQRDIRFFADLVVNWSEDYHVRRDFVLMNNQIKRYLDYLVSEGFAACKARSKTPTYQLTRVGLLELLARMRAGGHTLNRQRFLFVHYFISTYKQALTDLVAKQGKQFPQALKLELDQLLDEKSLLSNEITLIEKELNVLETRISDAKATSNLVKQAKKLNRAESEIIAEVEERYPYELNSQKPLSELIRALPESARIWEIEVGPLARVRYIWEPARKLLQAYLHELHILQE